MQPTKSQSAMEYLMTYGWSILIVAVVLGALSFLGVFNPITFAPKASAGGCQVIRNTELGISNLVGSCNNQVPQYVAQFNGQNSIITSTHIFPEYITITAWIKPSSNTIGTIVAENGPYYLAFGNSQISKSDCVGGGVLPSGTWIWLCGNSKVQINSWSQIAMTYDGSNESVYLNGKLDGYLSTNGPLHTNGGQSLRMGWGDPGYNQYFNGYISNVQIYNTSLSNSSIKLLYQEGIGGAPINLQDLKLWYPLNGDASDYSGNDNNGVSRNVSFTSDWYGGYTQP